MARLELTCTICRDFYDDPVLARDGYAYCRRCILKWTLDKCEWISPRTGQLLEGTAVLCADVERSCLAREARLGELRAQLPTVEVPDLWALVAARHARRPLLQPEDCAALLRRAQGQELPTYLHLELAHRAGALTRLPSRSLRLLPAQDRACVRVPLLRMDVLCGLLREAARRLRAEGSAEALETVGALKAHVTWRAAFGDAVEIPLDRCSHDCFRGLYYRDWQQASLERLTFSKEAGGRARLSVPLESKRQRGSAELDLPTEVQSLEPRPLRERYCSESDEALPPTEALGRSSRGAPPFPDSRGGESDEEDVQTTVPVSLTVLQPAPQHLPRDFGYCPHRAHDAHRDELLRALAPVQEALLDHLWSGQPHAKRARGS